jgi:hypothetical protein
MQPNEVRPWLQRMWPRRHLYGGINNARNRIQTGIRFAMGHGAGLILPSVASRPDDDLDLFNGGTLSPAVFFDTSFLENLSPTPMFTAPNSLLR